ncbi:MAG: tRNA adenosine(34) deaminase TadA [Candidatus Eremiobacterota bacterium]
MTQTEEDVRWMQQALALAREALEAGEIPVGAVLVQDGRILGQGRNRRAQRKTPLAHAEIEALEQAASRLGDWRFPGATLYVTLEPCPMCAGAILQARVDRVVFGADSPEQGAAGTRLNLLDYPGLAWRARISPGLLADESAALLKLFFEGRRGEVAEPG